MEVIVVVGLMLIVPGLNTAQGQTCCTPDQWEGLYRSTTGSFKEERWTLTSESSYFYYDYTNQRSASFTNTTDSFGQESSVERLVLYSAPDAVLEYKLDLKTKICTVLKTSVPFKRFCIQDWYHKMENLTLGAAAESVPVSVYYFKFPNTSVQVSATVTRNLCIPVSEMGRKDVEREDFLLMTEYADIKLGISQPSVFTVPPECQSHNTLFADKTSAKFPLLHSLTEPYLHL